jgi:hypothetical protein
MFFHIDSSNCRVAQQQMGAILPLLWGNKKGKPGKIGTMFHSEGRREKVEAEEGLRLDSEFVG